MAVQIVFVWLYQVYGYTKCMVVPSVWLYQVVRFVYHGLMTRCVVRLLWPDVLVTTATCDSLNLIVFGHKQLCQSPAPNRLHCDSKMLCPSATTNYGHLYQQNLIHVEGDGLWEKGPFTNCCNIILQIKYSPHSFYGESGG